MKILFLYKVNNKIKIIVYKISEKHRQFIHVDG